MRNQDSFDTRTLRWGGLFITCLLLTAFAMIARA